MDWRRGWESNRTPAPAHSTPKRAAQAVGDAQRAGAGRDGLGTNNAHTGRENDMLTKEEFDRLEPTDQVVIHKRGDRSVAYVVRKTATEDAILRVLAGDTK